MKFLISFFLFIFLLISNSIKASENQYKLILESRNDLFVLQLDVKNTIGLPSTIMTLFDINTEIYDALMEFTCLCILNPWNVPVLAEKYYDKLGSSVADPIKKATKDSRTKYLDAFADAGLAMSSSNPSSRLLHYMVYNMTGEILDADGNQLYFKKCRDIIDKQLNEHVASSKGLYEEIQDNVYKNLPESFVF